MYILVYCCAAVSVEPGDHLVRNPTSTQQAHIHALKCKTKAFIQVRPEKCLLRVCLQVIPLKLLGKAPRGSTAKAFHGLKPSSKLVYADQVQVSTAGFAENGCTSHSCLQALAVWCVSWIVSPGAVHGV